LELFDIILFKKGEERVCFYSKVAYDTTFHDPRNRFSGKVANNCLSDELKTAVMTKGENQEYKKK